jgi:hypothetical protein
VAKTGDFGGHQRGLQLAKTGDFLMATDTLIDVRGLRITVRLMIVTVVVVGSGLACTQGPRSSVRNVRDVGWTRARLGPLRPV